jgi:ubiquinone/menaquinone biosynthesis C-methylase UbiE
VRRTEVQRVRKRDRVVKQWDAAAESWVDFVRRGKDYYRDELNNPAAFRLIGNVKGRVVLDLACGEGYNTRILARRGAKVTGIDLSMKLIELAKREEFKEKMGITYHVADAADLSCLTENHFDLVTCFMALHDIEDYRKTVSEVARVLKNKGRFVFSIPHPCFEMIVKDGNRMSTNLKYFVEVEDHVQWRMERLLKPFVTTSFHRTLTDYSNVLSRNSLLIKRLLEPKPTKKGLEKHPPLNQVLLRPQSIIFECLKESNLDMS